MASLDLQTGKKVFSCQSKIIHDHEDPEKGDFSQLTIRVYAAFKDTVFGSIWSRKRYTFYLSSSRKADTVFTKNP